MSDFNQPTVNSQYADVISFLKNRDVDLALQLDPILAPGSNLPTNAVRFNRAGAKWENFNGTTWGDLASTYSISISGLAGSATVLATGRTFALSGDATGTSAAFNGSGNATIPVTLATVTAAKGGTGITSFATGDLLYANGTSSLAKLAAAATGNVLISNGIGAAPSYGKVTLTVHVDGILPVANGGTGSSTSTGSGSVVLANSPTFTGAPAAPSAAADTETTQLATTAFVLGQASTTTPAVDGTAAAGTSKKYARGDHVHPTDTSRAAAGSITASGLTIGTAKLVGRSTAGSGALEEIGLSGLTLSGGVLSSASAYKHALFNASGTWTCPAGVTSVKVTVIGAGGCGGYNKGTTVGGPGGYATGVYSVTPSTGYSVTVGTGGVTGGANGAAGGSSAFSSFISASGGGPGNSPSWGVGSGGNIINGYIAYGRGALSGAAYGAEAVYPNNGSQGGILIEYIG